MERENATQKTFTTRGVHRRIILTYALAGLNVEIAIFCAKNASLHLSDMSRRQVHRILAKRAFPTHSLADLLLREVHLFATSRNPLRSRTSFFSTTRQAPDRLRRNVACKSFPLSTAQFS